MTYFTIKKHLYQISYIFVSMQYCSSTIDFTWNKTWQKHVEPAIAPAQTIKILYISEEFYYSS